MLVETNPKLYFFIAQGMTTIDNVDDAKEMKDCDEAFDILNFSQVRLIAQSQSLKLNIFLIFYLSIARETRLFQGYWCCYALW